MKIRIYIIGALMAMSASLMAQSEQQISVLEYNGKEDKTPLSQVSINVLNAGATLSDDKGEATLKFRTLHAGDHVSVRRIEKAGYEIFNSQAIEQWNVSPQRTFQIVLCKSDKLMALRNQYSQVASKSYEKQYKAELAKLAAERKKIKMLEETYQQKLLELENQYQQQLEDLENYVDQFARIDLSELNNEQQELINLVKEGKIDEAIQKYESADYQAQYRTQCQEISKIDRAQAQLLTIEAQKRSDREKVYQAIQRQITTYRLAGGRENFQKVTNLLKSVADADTTFIEAVREYAFQALHQNLYEESETYWGIYIRGCKDYPYEQAQAYILLGDNSVVQHDFQKSENYVNQAISILKQFDNHNDTKLKATYKLINIYLWTDQIEKAKALQVSAIEECETLYKAEPADYASILTDLYSSNCRIHAFCGNVEESMAYGKKALEIARTLDSSDVLEIFIYLSALGSVGQACYISENWMYLLEILQEQANLVDQLYQINPEKHVLDVFSTYSNLADIQLHINEIEKSEQAFQKAETILSEFIGHNTISDCYQQFTLYETGARLYKQKGNQEKMIFYRDAAIKAYGQLPSNEQNSFTKEFEGLKQLQ